MHSRSRPRSQSHNEALIRNMMKAAKKRGNPADWVVLVGFRLIDYGGSYDVITSEEFEFKSFPEPTLAHKRDLHKLIGKKQAARFWRRKLGLRVPQERPQRTGAS